MPDRPSNHPEPAPDPEGWQRFERAVDAALHTPAKHKPKAKGESSPAPKDGKREA
jgi:hypothetical protein